MGLDDILTLIFFALFFVGPVILRLLRKKKGPLPKSKDDFEKLYKIKVEQSKSHEHLKPPPLQPPRVEPAKTTLSNLDIPKEALERAKTTVMHSTNDHNKQSSSIFIDGRRDLSSSYELARSRDSSITSRHIESSVSERHVESGIEELNYQSLLQQRFSEDILENGQKSSYVKGLLKKTGLKGVAILSEILRRPY